MNLLKNCYVFVNRQGIDDKQHNGVCRTAVFHTMPEGNRCSLPSVLLVLAYLNLAEPTVCYKLILNKKLKVLSVMRIKQDSKQRLVNLDIINKQTV